MLAAIDFGLTNTKRVFADAHGSVTEMRMWPSQRPFAGVETLRAIFAHDKHDLRACTAIAVTGGQSAQLPDIVDGVPISKVSELTAIGQGGLALLRIHKPNQLNEALIVSCGTGTAMMAVRGDQIAQSTGTAIGGGTLLGLGRLLLGTADPREIDVLAEQGDPAGVDLTLFEAVGGAFGRLPADTTAANFGKLASSSSTSIPTRFDTAAGLVTLIAQAISSIALNAARAEKLERIVMIGNLPALGTVATQMQRAAGFHGTVFDIPANGGYAMALGALAALNRPDSQ
jgi:type II pantothenate kinase